MRPTTQLTFAHDGTMPSLAKWPVQHVGRLHACNAALARVNPCMRWIIARKCHACRHSAGQTSTPKGCMSTCKTCQIETFRRFAFRWVAWLHATPDRSQALSQCPLTSLNAWVHQLSRETPKSRPVKRGGRGLVKTKLRRFGVLLFGEWHGCTPPPAAQPHSPSAH